MYILFKNYNKYIILYMRYDFSYISVILLIFNYLVKLKLIKIELFIIE